MYLRIGKSCHSSLFWHSRRLKNKREASLGRRDTKRNPEADKSPRDIACHLKLTLACWQNVAIACSDPWHGTSLQPAAGGRVRGRTLELFRLITRHNLQRIRRASSLRLEDGTQPCRHYAVKWVLISDSTQEGDTQTNNVWMCSLDFFFKHFASKHLHRLKKCLHLSLVAVLMI